MNEQLSTLGSQAFTLGLAVLLLFWGRKFFWLVGATMFAIIGLGIAALVLDPARFQVEMTPTAFRFNIDTLVLPPEYYIAAAVGAVIGIIFTVRFPRAAAAVVGFTFGMLSVALVFLLFSVSVPDWVRRSLFIIMGTIVALIALRQPAETIILLTTFMGTGQVMDLVRVNENSPAGAFVWLISMLVGIIFQTNTWRKEQRRHAAQPRVTASAPSPSE